MKSCCLVLLVGFLFSEQRVSAQQKEFSAITVTRVGDPVKIDGMLDESAWTSAAVATPFYNKWPRDSGFAEAKTEVKVLFNDQFIYIAAVSYQRKEDLIIQTLKRDQMEAFWGSDAFSIVLDPINQKTNGFLFGVNAGGAQLEGAINLVGSWSRINENWDNKWFSATKVFDDYWIAEIAIPFTALRFKSGATAWGLNFIRNDMKRNVYSTWSRVPLQLNGVDLGHTGTLQWGEQLTPEKSIATVIPYVSGSHGRNFEEGEDTRTAANAGMDMKIPLTSSLNVDLTFRPDFSNVDVDRQMTNVTRFSLLFPERRNFFLENADLFTNFGSWLVRPFFSRRIGLHEGEPIPILAGARISGNVTKGLRVGIMDIQTEATDEFSANNYLLTAFQQQLVGRSNVKFIGASRQTTKISEGSAEHVYNRMYGSEFQYVSGNGNLNAYVRAHAAHTPEKLDQSSYVSSQVNYMNSKFYTGVLAEQVGENYVNDFGFIPRLYNYDPLRDTTVRIGHYTINPWFGYMHYPKNSGSINFIEPNTWSVINYRTTGEFLERSTSVNFTIAFKNTRQLFADAFITSVNLPFVMDLIENAKPIPVGRYDFTQYSVKYTTDSRKALSGDIRVGYGGFYNGSRMEYGATLNFRKQPWGSFGIGYLQNDIELPGEYGRASFKLICPRAEVSLRNNMWWTTFLQYNTQQDNFNVNSRFQWRFKSMSDFFIVYTDNYDTGNMKVKNRSVVFKVTYWLNL